MVVEIDPTDVVSVPHDCSCQKLRTSKYKVVGVYETIEAPPLESYDDDFVDWDEEVTDEWNEGYAAGLNAANLDK